MEIKVLGTGCSRCKTLLTTVEQVVTEIGLNATITKVDDILKIMEYNVMGLPALVVDEKVLEVLLFPALHRASVIFSANDVIINIGVIIAALFVWWLESNIPDLIIGIVVFLVVIRGAIRILKLAK